MHLYYSQTYYYYYYYHNNIIVSTTKHSKDVAKAEPDKRPTTINLHNAHTQEGDLCYRVECTLTVASYREVYTSL